MSNKRISYRTNYSTLPPNTSRLDYGTRITHGHRFEKDLPAHLATFGIKTTPFGRALLSRDFQSELTFLNDGTSAFLRYLPDLAGRLPNRGSSFLIEAKSTLSTTGNYSINLTSYTMQRDLVQNYNPPYSLRILYIFPPPYQDEDYRADWVEHLHRAIFKQISEPELLKTAGGSRLPFALLAKDRLRPLAAVLNEFIGNAQNTVNKSFVKDEYENKLYGIRF